MSFFESLLRVVLSAGERKSSFKSLVATAVFAAVGVPAAAVCVLL